MERIPMSLKTRIIGLAVAGAAIAAAAPIASAAPSVAVKVSGVTSDGVSDAQSLELGRGASALSRS